MATAAQSAKAQNHFAQGDGLSPQHKGAFGTEGLSALKRLRYEQDEQLLRRAVEQAKSQLQHEELVLQP